MTVDHRRTKSRLVDHGSRSVYHFNEGSYIFCYQKSNISFACQAYNTTCAAWIAETTLWNLTDWSKCSSHFAFHHIDIERYKWIWKTIHSIFFYDILSYFNNVQAFASTICWNIDAWLATVFQSVRTVLLLKSRFNGVSNCGYTDQWSLINYINLKYQNRLIFL